MGRKVKDLTGQTFGKLTVVSLLPTRAKNGKAQWRCRCSCGNWSPCVVSNNLLRGYTTSCGCVRDESAAKNGRSTKTHGLTGQTGNAHYARWRGMKGRTANPNRTDYKNYGGRGIRLHQQWEESFVEFKAWLDENLGPCPEGFSLDRIDNDGHYEPGNLRWASKTHQNRNRRKKSKKN